MAYADFDEMKKEFPARNFDNVDITEDFNIAAQNSAGVYGAFKFFHGIRSFFKGITALGKLASGSKILVTDESGNISYTTPSDITEGFATTESVNNALAKYWNGDITKKTNYQGDCNDLTFGMFTISSVATNTPNGKFGFLTSIYRSTSYQVQYYEVVETEETFRRYRYDNVWTSWEKITTESDLKNITISDTIHNFGNQGTSDEVYAEFDLSNYKKSPCAYIGVLRCGGANSQSFSFNFTLTVSYSNWSFILNGQSSTKAELTFDTSTSTLKMKLTDKSLGFYEDKLTLLKIQ